METQTVRISAADYAALNEMSKASGKPMSTLLGEAIQAMCRTQLLQHTNDAYRRLKKNKTDRYEEQEERIFWDAALPECRE